MICVDYLELFVNQKRVETTQEFRQHGIRFTTLARFLHGQKKSLRKYCLSGFNYCTFDSQTALYLGQCSALSEVLLGRLHAWNLFVENGGLIKFQFSSKRVLYSSHLLHCQLLFMAPILWKIPPHQLQMKSFSSFVPGIAKLIWIYEILVETERQWILDMS